jgi:hypothetical protein
MPRWEDLPPDQRDALQLVARSGSYAGLGAAEDVVRARALAAAEALAPPPPGIALEESAAVVDRVLGVAGGDAASLSPPARRWSRQLRAALAPALGGAAPTEAAAPAPARARRRRSRPRPPGSVLVGAGVLAAALAALGLAIALGGDDSKKGSSARASTTPKTRSTQAAGDVAVRSQANLTAPGGGAAKAVVQLLTQGKTSAFQVVAQGITERPGTYVALWAQGGSTATPLAAVTNAKIEKGRFSGVTSAPPDLGRYDTLLLTRESERADRAPTTPSSDVVAQGTLDVRR